MSLHTLCIPGHCTTSALIHLCCNEGLDLEALLPLKTYMIMGFKPLTTVYWKYGGQLNLVDWQFFGHTANYASEMSFCDAYDARTNNVMIFPVSTPYLACTSLSSDLTSAVRL